MMIDLDIQSILACPQCTYNRYLPTWDYFVGLRLLAVLVIGCRYFDMVRLLALFIGYEVIYYFVWKLGVVLGYSSPGASMFLSVFMTTGLFAAIIMWCASHFTYLKKPSSPDFTWLRAMALIPFMMGIYVLQDVYVWQAKVYFGIEH